MDDSKAHYSDTPLLELLEPRLLLSGSLVISEFMARNDTSLADGDGEYSDWLELHNPGAETVDLTNWSLEDSKDSWTFPANTSLAPGEYMVLFASNGRETVESPTNPYLDPAGYLHTNFKLSGGGEYLGLLDDTGAVVHEYDEYPEQMDDVSYGLAQTVETTDFILSGDTARYLVPGSDPGAWTTPGFDDSTWLEGETGIGYSDLVPGFSLTTYRSGSAISDLTAAMYLIDTPGIQTFTYSANVPFIDYYNSGGSGHFTADQTQYPGLTGEADQFLIDATGFVDIPRAGAWSFGVNSDDGFSLELSNGINTFYMEYPGLRGSNDTISTFNIPQAGVYSIRLVQFENAGGASGELFAAEGSYGVFDTNAFKLVGDTANGGLVVNSIPIGGSGGSGGFAGLIKTDVETLMEGQNNSIYARVPFTLEAADMLPGAISSLTLKMKYDDGYVAYLNGVKIAESNAPATPLWNSSAMADRTDAQAAVWEYVSATDFIDQLVLGENILAIQGLNYPADDADFLLLPELLEITATGIDEHYLAIGTPGDANTAEYWLYVDDTKFSHDRGFYDAPFDLEITTDTDGADIYYTIDGSEPSETNGTLYTTPITISGTTTVRAIAVKNAYEPTDVDTQTYLFLADVITQSSSPDGFPTDWNGVAADYEMDETVTLDPLYEGQLLAAMQSLPSMSIVMDVDQMFGPSGIYSNPGGDLGEAWERPTSLEYINPDGTTGFQVNAGIRMYGGAFRQNWSLTRKKSFRVFFKDEYGPTKLDYDLFQTEGASTSFDSIILRGGSNDGWNNWGKEKTQYIVDEYMRRTQLALGDPGSHGTFVHLYINGLYWGLYNPVERPDAAFSADYFGGEKENWDSIHDSVPTGDSNIASWNAMINQVRVGLTDNAEYEKIQGNNPDGTDNPAYVDMLDVDNFITYMFSNFWGGTGDWPGHNWYGAGQRVPDDTGFKFFNWDSEGAIIIWSDLNRNVLGVNNGNTPGEIWAGIKQNAEFRMRFADHAHAYLFNDGPASADASRARYEELATTVELAIIAESARWGDQAGGAPYTQAHWAGYKDYVLDTYMPQRPDVFLQQLKGANLYPSTAAPSFNINGTAQHGGTVDLGDSFTIDAPAGQIYVTTDGSDPRPYGGGAPDAGDLYSGTYILTAGSHFKARVYDSASGQWSALNEAAYCIDLAPDIRITEIMYNPSEPTAAEIAAGYTDNDDFEFIEIQNISNDDTLPLEGLRLTNGVQYTFGDVSIAPGEYIILASNPAAFLERYDDFTGTVLGPFVSGSLNNAGEKLQLDSPIGGIIHDFKFGDGWYNHTDGDGFSLTIRDPQGAGELWDQKIGWRASEAPGGSPGYSDVLTDPGAIIINEVLAHSDSPHVDTIELYNTSDSPVDVSGWFLSDSGLDLTAYKIPNTPSIPAGGYLVLYGDTHFGGDFLLSEHGDDVYLSSNTNEQAGGYRRHVDFGASPKNVPFGVHTTSTGATDFTLLSERTFGEANAYPYFEGLVVNEIMYHPPAPTEAEKTAGFVTEDDFEFIEIYNTSTETLTLSDYYLSGGVGFSAGWLTSNADPSSTEYRTREPGATASWEASLRSGPHAYEVLVRWDMLDGTGDERNLDGRAEYVITYDGGVTAPIIVDQFQPDPTLPFYMDPSGWVSLGTYTFDGTGQVTLTRGTRNPDNWTVAAELKFASPPDTQIVASPTLDSWSTSNAPATIAPGEYKIIVRNYDAFTHRYSVPAGTILGEYTGALSNNGDQIKLMRAGEAEGPAVNYYIPFYRIDNAKYNDVLPWPTEADGVGSTLSRRRPGPDELYAADPTSWSAGTHLGTPGELNILVDTTPPPPVTGLAATVVVEPALQIDLTWSPASDPESHIDHYVVYRDGELVTTTTLTVYSDTNVSMLTPYSYQVVAVNRDQYASDLSTQADVTIPGAIRADLIDDTTVRIVFSTLLVEASAEDFANYTFSGGAIQNIELISPNVVEFTLPQMQLSASYNIVVAAIDTVSGQPMPAGQQLDFVYYLAEGMILYEYWTGIGGTSTGDLLSSPNYPDNPSGSDMLDIFEASTDWSNEYGARIRGYIFPEITGDYTFWIASDDNSQLLLSTNHEPANAVQIAEVTGWVGSRQWFNNASQESAPIHLIAGHKYYIEALHKEGGGGDNLSVAWQVNDQFEGPIPGSRLSPYDLGVSDVTPPSAPEAVTALAVSSTQIDVAWEASSDPETGIDHYVIYRDGQQIGVTPNGTLTFSDTIVGQSQTYVYSVRAVNGDGLVSDAAAADPVSPPPGLYSVAAISDTQIIATFGEAVDEASAENLANYSISFGGGESIAISSVAWEAASPQQVALTLNASLAEGVSYTLNVQNVQDTGGAPIIGLATMAFEYSDAWSFDAGLDGFVYADDAFNGTTNPDKAAGSHEPTGGLTGGGLRVYLGPGPINGAMSGAWSRDFVAEANGVAEVSLKYRMTLASGYEPDEYGQVILEIDGVRYGTDIDASLIHSTGSDPTDSGWLEASFSVPVTAGLHTITIGAYNNKATAGDEVTNAYFDDVMVSIIEEHAPTADIVNVSPDPLNYGIDEIQIVFSEAVSGFELSDLSLTRDGGANLLSGAQSLTSADNITWTLGGLALITEPSGVYEITLTADGSGIENASLVALVEDASDVWEVDSQAPSIDIEDVTPDPRDSAVVSIDIVFDEPVIGLDISDLILTRDDGANLLTGSQTLTTTDNITWTLGGLSDLTGQPGGSGFVAFNDHIAGGSTHANATLYAVNGTSGGQLKDITSGLGSGVTLTVTQSGVSYASNGSNPASGTDAYDIFNGYVDFQDGVDTSIEIQGANNDHYTHAFTGLDTGSATTYNFHGTAIRGDSGYTNRWTLVTLVGADGFTADHSSGIGVVTDGLAANQVAIWVGANHAASQGFVSGWTNIDPGSDGAFTVVSTQYIGPTPGVGSGTSNGDKGYGLAGLRLEEVGASAAAGVYELQLIAAGSGITDQAGNALVDDASDQWITTQEGMALIVDRHVFYNTAGGDDDAAIDAGKQLLEPGQTATSVNYSSFAGGVNGIMIDVANLGGTPSAGDFVFKAGNDLDPAGWSVAPAAHSISVRPGQGVGGSDRVTLVWADGAISDQWLEVTVKSDGNINIEADDVFYFGNLTGDGNGDGSIDAGDFGDLLGQFGQSGSNQSGDFNGDNRVDMTDFVILRNGFGNALSQLQAPAATPIVAAAPEAEAALLAPEPAVEAIVEPLDDEEPVAAPLPDQSVDWLIDPVDMGSYVSESEPVATRQVTAADEHDLSPLSDDPLSEASDDPLDLLVDSPVILPL
ncbi:MAG: hypothetical protein HN350_03695 [Phycisphaerales bacterium]|nr:hypothetical protein [Phycisphaerales bacterium]